MVVLCRDSLDHPGSLPEKNATRAGGGEGFVFAHFPGGGMVNSSPRAPGSSPRRWAGVSCPARDIGARDVAAPVGRSILRMGTGKSGLSRSWVMIVNATNAG
jgi:hypothetical protein